MHMFAFFHAECLRGWFGLPCPTCRATWTRDMTQEMGRLNATPILMNRRQFFTNQRLPPPLDVVPLCHARVEPNGDLSANFAMVWTGSRREWTCMTCHRTVSAFGRWEVASRMQCEAAQPRCRIHGLRTLCVDYGFHGVYWSCCSRIGDEIYIHGCEPTWTAEYWLLQHQIRPSNGALASLVDLTNDVDVQAVATGTAVATGSAVQQVVANTTVQEALATDTTVQEVVATGTALQEVLATDETSNVATQGTGIAVQ